MRNSEKCCKLIETLRTFSNEEFHEFEKVARSSCFNKGRNYIPYIKVLKKYFPEFEGEMFYKQNVRRYIFEQTHPDSPYNDQHMKNIFTELIHLAEETLYQKVTKRYNYQNLIYLSFEESKRNLLNLAGQNINKLEQKLDETGIDELYFFYKGMEEIASSVIENKSQGKTHETGRTVTTGVPFIYFSVIMSALSIFNSNVRSAMLDFKDEPGFTKRFAGFIDYNKTEKLITDMGGVYKEIILIFICYLKHSAGVNGFENYKKMRNLVFRNYNIITSRMLFYISSMLEWMLYENKDKIDSDKFYREYLRLAIFSIHNECYRVTNYSRFQFIRFRSYYLNALSLGEAAWLKEFSNKYTHLLPSGLINETTCLINANLMFEDGEYDCSFEELKKTKMNHILSKIDMRILKLKIYYEKDLILQAENSLENFVRFIGSSQNLPRVFRSNFKLFIKHYSNLLSLENDQKLEPEMLVDEVKNMHAFPERNWILKKLEKKILG